MVNEPIHAFKPDYAVHPGEYLAEVLEARELRKSDLADRLGVSVKHVSQIINRKEGVSADLAVRLERALGVSANIWSNLNADYSLFMARSREAGELRSRKSWLREFPVRDLIKAGWLPDLEDRGTLLEKLLEFFGISSPDQWLAYYDQRQTCFRKSGAFRDHLPHLASWLRIGELLAAGREVEAFDGKTFKEVLLEIRALSCEKPARFVPEMENLCARAGVVLVFVPEVGRTHVSGATRWLTPEKALLMMSLRYKTNDHFWFTFFHEAGHILQHGKKEVFIDDPKGFASVEEEEADRFARNLLIPEAEYRSFSAAEFFTRPAVTAFARRLGIHPGIIVGRLQHEKRIPFSWHNTLKERFELTFPRSER